MNIINDLVTVDSIQLICTESTLRTSGLVQNKIKFDDQLTADLTECGFDFDNFNQLKAQYAVDRESVKADLQASAPKVLYLKQRKRDAEPVAVAIAIDGQVFLNKNVDSKLGVGAEATRYKYAGYINGFIQFFGLRTESLEYYNGAPFVCTESAYDDRKTGAIKSDDSTLDW